MCIICEIKLVSKPNESRTLGVPSYNANVHGRSRTMSVTYYSNLSMEYLIVLDTKALREWIENWYIFDEVKVLAFRHCLGKKVLMEGALENTGHSPGPGACRRESSHFTCGGTALPVTQDVPPSLPENRSLHKSSTAPGGAPSQPHSCLCTFWASKSLRTVVSRLCL